MSTSTQPSPSSTNPEPKTKHQLISLQQLDFALSKLGLDSHVTSEDIFRVLDEEEDRRRSGSTGLPGWARNKRIGDEAITHPNLDDRALDSDILRDRRTEKLGASTTFTEGHSPPADPDPDPDELHRELVVNLAEETVPDGSERIVDPHITPATPA